MSEEMFNGHRFFVPESLLNRLMGDRDLVRQVLEACLPDLRAKATLLENQLGAGVYEDAARTVHSIKGSAQNSDLKALALLSAEIEDALKGGDTERALFVHSKFSLVLEKSVQAVDGYFSGVA